MTENKDEIANKLLTQLLNAVYNKKPFLIINKHNEKKIIFPEGIVAIQTHNLTSEITIEINYVTKNVFIKINDSGEIDFFIRADNYYYS